MDFSAGRLSIRRGTSSIWIARALTLAALAANGTALAQSCTQIPQLVQNGALANSFTNWTLACSPGNGSGGCTGGTGVGSGWTTNQLGGSSAQHWDDQGQGGSDGANPTVPTGYDTMTQTISNVSGGAVLQFDYAWNNAQYRFSSGGQQPWDGNQAELSITYAGTQYFVALTAPFSGASPIAAPGPTAGSSISSANNAVILSGTVAAPTNVSGAVAFLWSTIRVRLPDNIPNSGALSIRVRRMQNDAIAASGRATDDFYVRNVSVNDRTLCIVKTTPAGNGGLFNFTTGNLKTAGATNTANPSFALTTSSAMPTVAYDSDSVTAGTQPALVSANAVTITESTLTAYSLTGVACQDNSGTAVTSSISASTVTVGVAGTAGQPDPAGAITAGLMTTCTLTNTPSTNISIAKTDLSAVYSPGGNATYTLTVTNNGGPASPIVLTDTLPKGITVNSMSCVASAGSSCGAAAQTTPFSSATGTTPIALYNNASMADGRTTAQTITITLNVTFAATPAAY